MAAYKDKNGKWYISVYYTNWQGKRDRKVKRGFSTKREALEWEREFLNQTSGDLDMTFEAFVGLYKRDLKERLKLNTWVMKTSVIDQKILPYFKNRKISEIKAADIIAWQNVMLTWKDERGDGVVAHNRRTYFAENVDPTRTHLNVEYCYTPIEEAYHQLFDAALAEFNAKQKRKDRCIENYYEKIRDGKQEKPFYEVIFQVGNKDDMGTVGENAELAKTILDKFYRSFLERNPHLRVYSAHLHMDEATPHLHIDFIPFTTGSKRGLSTRVSLKQALADQGITGEGRSLTERDLWVQKEKEALAEIMLEHGIEWEQKGEHKEHLSVLEFKREKRKEELAELEQSIERVQQQQVSIQAVEQIEAKPLPLTSKVAVDREDYQNLVTAAQKYVVQEKQEGKLKKLLKEAKKTISDLKAKIQSLTAELSAVKAELAQYKSVRGKLRTADLEQENSRLRSKIRSYESAIERNDLWYIFNPHRNKTHNRDDAR